MVHQVFDPAFAGYVPYVVALVDLAEGPRLVTRLVGVDTVRRERWLPVFRCTLTPRA